MLDKIQEQYNKRIRRRNINAQDEIPFGCKSLMLSKEFCFLYSTQYNFYIDSFNIEKLKLNEINSFMMTIIEIDGSIYQQIT